MKSYWRRFGIAGLLGLVCLLCACSGYENYGGAGEKCYADLSCDDGLHCVEGLCVSNPSDSDLADSENPDGDTPDGDTPDGDFDLDFDLDFADGDTPDGDTFDGDTPDGDRDSDSPDGDTPDGDTPDGDTSDGDTPDGDHDSDLPDGDTDEIETDHEIDPCDCPDFVGTYCMDPTEQNSFYGIVIQIEDGTPNDCKYNYSISGLPLVATTSGEISGCVHDSTQILDDALWDLYLTTNQNGYDLVLQSTGTLEATFTFNKGECVFPDGDEEQSDGDVEQTDTDQEQTDTDQDTSDGDIDGDSENMLPVALVALSDNGADITAPITIPSTATSAQKRLTLYGTISYDPDGDYPLEYQWSLTKPALSNATLSPNEQSGIVTFEVDIVGQYVVELVVTDSRGLSSFSKRVLVNYGNEDQIDIEMTFTGEGEMNVQLGWQVPNGTLCDDQSMNASHECIFSSCGSAFVLENTDSAANGLRERISHIDPCDGTYTLTARFDEDCAQEITQGVCLNQSNTLVNVLLSKTDDRQGSTCLLQDEMDEEGDLLTWQVTRSNGAFDFNSLPCVVTDGDVDMPDGDFEFEMSEDLPEALPFEFTREDEGTPLSEEQIEHLSRSITGLWQKIDYWQHVRRTSHGNDASTGKRDWMVWWSDVEAIKSGDTVTFKHNDGTGGGHNIFIRTSKVLSQAIGAYLSTGDSDAGEIVKQYCKGITAAMLGMMYDEYDQQDYLMARNIVGENHSFTVDGRNKAVDFSAWYYSSSLWNASRFNYANNPSWGSVWVTNMQSKDNAAHIFRAAPFIRYAAEYAPDADVKAAAAEAWQYLQGFTRDIVDSGYYIRSKDENGNPFIPGHTGDTEADQSVGDIASFVDWEDLFPNAECGAKLSAALIGYAAPLSNNCGLYDNNSYETTATAVHYYNYAIVRNWHTAALGGSLLRHRDSTAETLLEGLGMRIDRYMADDDERLAYGDKWDRDLAHYILQAASEGLPLKSSEAALIYQYYLAAVQQFKDWPYYDLWDESVPDGQYDYRPDDSDSAFRYEDLALLQEYCWSPLRNPAGAQVIDCGIINDPLQWDAAYLENPDGDVDIPDGDADPEICDCYIDGTCYATGARGPKDCLVCNPYGSGADDEWSADTAGGWCYIGGECYQNLHTDPTNSCQKCDLFYNDTSWTPMTDGTACGTDDQCVSGTCEDCYDVGGCSDLDWGERDDECAQMQCQNNTCSFSNDAANTLCQSDGSGDDSDQCDGSGYCKDCVNVNGCGDMSWNGRDGECTEMQCQNGVCSFNNYAANTACQVGGTGDDSDQCDGSGYCKDCTTAAGCSDLADDGLECSEPFCDTDRTCKHNLAAHESEICTDDTLSCTDDLCATNGQCNHTLKQGRCLIDETCYQHNQEQSDNRCHYCDTGVATDIWTWRSFGYDCDDSLFCNGDDTCNGSGECIHDGNPCPETECNTCQEDVDSCFDPAGTACGSTETTTCTAPDTCNGAGVCLDNHIENGEGCEFDGVDCTLDECQNGICTAGEPDDLYCDLDNNPKTHDACDAIYGCYDAGWAVTFGGTGVDLALGGIVQLADGGMALAGYIHDTVDFDPSDEEDNHTSNGSQDVFLSIFDSSGNYIWGKTFGGTMGDDGWAITQLVDGGFAVTGHFQRTVDFDPSEAEDEYTASGTSSDVFVTVFSNTGEYRWSRVFGGTSDDYGKGITQLSDGGLAVVGHFQYTVDFDPGSGTENHSSSGESDVFVSVFDANGDHRWSRTFGGESADYGHSVVELTDGSIALTGFFQDTVDFNPGTETDEHTSNGEKDIFVSVFNTDGSYRWGQSFGGTYTDEGNSITSLNGGGLALTGIFNQTVDFNPGPEVEEHTSNGTLDVFVSVFDPNGIHVWTNTFGGGNHDQGVDVVQMQDGSLALTGAFMGTVDFDPGTGVDEHTNDSGSGLFISIFENDGSYRSSYVVESSSVKGVAPLANGGLGFAGGFSNTVDFNSGSRTDEQTSNGDLDIFLLRINLPPVCSLSDPNACSNHGTCDWSSGTGVCNCETGFGGETCERCASNYDGYPDCYLAHTPGFVSIDAGTFWMGSPDGCPGPDGYPGDCTAEIAREPWGANEELHKVNLTYDFEIQQYETTQAEFVELMTTNPSRFTTCDGVDGGSCPVEQTSWYDALAFANQLSISQGLSACFEFASVDCESGGTVGSDYMNCFDSDSTNGGIDDAVVTLSGGATIPQECEGYRLPTEAEWEYSIRTGDQYTPIYQSDGNDGSISSGYSDSNMDQIAWYSVNSDLGDGLTTHPVGLKEPNAWNLFDMSGNVWEWTWNCYFHDYEIDNETDPIGPTSLSIRAKRGGSWYFDAQDCRSASRRGGSPDERYGHCGFRLVRTLPVPSCDPDPCNGHGTCSEPGEGETRPSCECDPEFDGYWCNRCAEGKSCYPHCIDTFTCSDGICKDPTTCFEWQQTPTGGTMDWTSAVSHCESLSLDGNGWKLPNISELRSLIRNCPPIENSGACGVFDECSLCGVSSEDVCLELSCHEDNACMPDSCSAGGNWYWPDELGVASISNFWSSSSYSLYGWFIYFNSGDVAYMNKTTYSGVRCVRGGP